MSSFPQDIDLDDAPLPVHELADRMGWDIEQLMSYIILQIGAMPTYASITATMDWNIMFDHWLAKHFAVRGSHQVYIRSYFVRWCAVQRRNQVREEAKIIKAKG